MRNIFIIFIMTTLSALAQTMHPTFPLLDANGDNVLHTGQPVSTMNTCGDCHDTEYISNHSYHSDVGFSQLTEPGETTSGRAWDMSPGLYGRWNPMVYRVLSPPGDEHVDLTTEGWIQIFGARHVGGGPASKDRITETVEMNCFLCHIKEPNNDARIAALRSSQFAWANTATLAGIGVVERAGPVFRYNPAAFDPDGHIKSVYLKPHDPSNDNCGQCHGLVHADRNTPLITSTCEPEYWMTETTGQIISPQRMSDSGLNLANKNDLSRSWDIHAERVLKCTDCHFSINNPIFYQESEKTRPSHLTFSPRRQTISDYLYRPSHQFARGTSSYKNLIPELQGSMRRCESCHDSKKTHDWLPYRARHMQAMTCESCHIPHMYAPARRVMDWTMITPDGEPRMECRGFDGEPKDIRTLITGYEPVLLPRQELDGSTRLSPFNMVTFWYWTCGEPKRPVRFADLQRAIVPTGDYHPDILAAFDADKDGALSRFEMSLDSDAKIEIITSRLRALGLDFLKIKGEIQPYGIHHNVTHGDWVTRDCESCHHRHSKLTRTFTLAEHPPKAELPKIVGDAAIQRSGSIFIEGGVLLFKENVRQAGLYILGHDSVLAVQIIGAASVLVVMLGIILHAGMRFLSAGKSRAERGAKKTVYMYAFYERFWHWLQAIAIIGLIFTGLIIHAPSVFGFISFPAAVIIHNVLAFILLVNAFLAVFYHFTSGEIRQFLPEPRGFFSQAVQQATYYLRGIFKGEKHPFEKNPEVKLNPLQKLTYLVILNILLPLQIITGVLIWGAQHVPDFLDEIGGLGVLVPIHSLVAWFFAAFLMMHIYLTTTGYTPLASIKAMIVGWEDIESHGAAEGHN
ncbi:cytochrome b/b6 domain-containing protein [candidate division KSB1 bacterium]|nr:cytochrome b/b6 domain-containing protein [candidate division KSB1 bacterium]